MRESLAPIQFLSSSANRVAVLTALADGHATRRDLQREVGGSRSTVARILSDAQEWGWVDSEGSRYWLTPLGETMIVEFRSYLETVEGVQHLGRLVDHLPPPLFDLDFRHLRDAEVVEPSAEDPAAHFTRAFELFNEATEYRGLTHTAFPHFTAAIRDGVVEGRVDYRGVIETAFVEIIREDPERSALWQSFTAVAETRGYDGTVPISFHVIDGRVIVWLGATRDVSVALLVSENPAVVSWADSLFERYWAESEPLGPI